MDFSNAAFGRWSWWGGNNASHAPNNTSWSSVSVANNSERVRVVAPVSGTYTFKIERFWNKGVQAVVRGGPPGPGSGRAPRGSRR